MNNLGSRLRNQRTLLKISQSQLGLIGGVGACAQWQMETGRRLPRADYLFKVAKVGVDIEYVVTGRQDCARKMFAAHHVSSGNHSEINRREILASLMLKLSQSWSITLDILTKVALLAETYNSDLIHDEVSAEWELNREQLSIRMSQIVGDGSLLVSAQS